ncbi:hypothetical protein J437_LFUL017981 [Ladona fulva]|uniref:C2H2-type domain-containing protein n=1 Tax=Ladona fulva TaxID=123851 RepID=A0A8K0KJP5_LADFU|nr:hypothetical protein J437_LFUL017981 [Ladona fulva]
MFYTSDSDKVSFDETNDGMGIEAENMLQNEADKLPEQVNEIYSDIAMTSVKDEIEIEEWTIPEELLMRPEITEEHISESGVIILQNAMNFCNDDLKISQEELEGPEEDNTSPDILSIQCANEEVSIKDCCADELSESATKGKSIQNEELDNSQSMKIPKCGSRKGFVCDICRKSFAGRRDIRDHKCLKPCKDFGLGPFPATTSSMIGNNKLMPFMSAIAIGTMGNTRLNSNDAHNCQAQFLMFLQLEAKGMQQQQQNEEGLRVLDYQMRCTGCCSSEVSPPPPNIFIPKTGPRELLPSELAALKRQPLL